MPPTGNQPRARGHHQQQQGRQNLRYRQPDERDEREGAIDPRVLLHRGEHAERHRQAPRHQCSGRGQQKRVGKPFAQDIEYRLVARKRLAEVEMQHHVLQVHPILHVPRLVEAEPDAHGLDGLGGDPGILRHLVEEVAGREL
jgi:hypothetical protein